MQQFVFKKSQSVEILYRPSTACLVWFHIQIWFHWLSSLRGRDLLCLFWVAGSWQALQHLCGWVFMNVRGSSLCIWTVCRCVGLHSFASSIHQLRFGGTSQVTWMITSSLLCIASLLLSHGLAWLPAFAHLTTSSPQQISSFNGVWFHAGLLVPRHLWLKIELMWFSDILGGNKLWTVTQQARCSLGKSVSVICKEGDKLWLSVQVTFPRHYSCVCVKWRIGLNYHLPVYGIDTLKPILVSCTNILSTLCAVCAIQSFWGLDKQPWYHWKSVKCVIWTFPLDNIDWLTYVWYPSFLLRVHLP